MVARAAPFLALSFLLINVLVENPRKSFTAIRFLRADLKPLVDDLEGEGEKVTGHHVRKERSAFSALKCAVLMPVKDLRGVALQIHGHETAIRVALIHTVDGHLEDP